MAPRRKLYIATPEDEAALAALARAEDFIHGFLSYLGLNNQQMLRYSLNCSGRHYDMTAWSNATRFTKPVAQREALRDPSAKVFLRSKGQMRRMRREKEERAAYIRGKRKEVAELSEQELNFRLSAVFKAYSSVQALIAGQGVKMDTIGYHRLLRDSRLLTNGLSVLDADDIYHQAAASASHDGEDELTDPKAAKQEGYLDLSQLRFALERIAAAKWPAKVAQAGAAMVAAKMLRHWVLPFVRTDRQRLPRLVDALYTPKTISLLRGLDQGLKASFSFFANLLALEHKDTSWRATVAKGSTLGAQEFYLYMLSFRVSPLLLGKAEVLEVLRKVEAETEADENVDEMLFPVFLEVLVECSLAFGEQLERKMSAASPSEIPALKRFLAGCVPHLQEEFANILFERGRIFERDEATGSPILPEPPKEEHFKAQMAASIDRWERTFKSHSQQYDNFHLQRRSLFRASLRHRQDNTSHLTARSGLAATPVRKAIHPSRQLPSSVDDFRALTSVNVYGSNGYDMVGRAGRFSLSSMLDSIPSISGPTPQATATTGAPSQMKGSGSDTVLAPFRATTAPDPTSLTQTASGAYERGQRQTGSSSGTRGEDKLLLELPVVNGDKQQQPEQQRVATFGETSTRETARKRDWRSAEHRFVEPRRFNHEANPHPRLLDPGVGVPGVRSFHREGLKAGQLDGGTFYLGSGAWGY